MNTLEKIVTDSVYLPSYELSRRLARLYPNDYIMETEDWDFDLREFAKGKQCQISLRDDIYGQFETDWTQADGGDIEPRNAMFEVSWRGCRIKVLRITRAASDEEKQRHWLISPHADDVKAFFAGVCRWSTEIRGEILVFSRGRWLKDQKLYEDVKKARLEDLVLPEAVKARLIDDVREFFESKDIYRQYGLPWKRGVLLIGPPGNGKTHMVKAIANFAGKPCLYVRGFKASRHTEHDCISMVFERARKSSPCILVFEDLDSMIQGQNRSFFLNELDGFASNEGILVIATTNYPEKLDPAILERPSRFDRKFTFTLPSLDERSAFMRLKNSEVERNMRLSEGGIEEVARTTEGFSFAYLKELWLSSMIAWMRERAPGTLDAIMKEQAKVLKSQMRKDAMPTPAIPLEDD